MVENVSHAAGSTDEVLVAQATELMAVHVKVLEGNAGGIDLVHVHDLLQPLPHLVLSPELRLGVTRPQAACVTRHHHRNWGQTSMIAYENIVKTALGISELTLFVNERASDEGNMNSSTEGICQ